MRAVLLREIGADLEVRDDLELDGPGVGEVRVRLAASGVCHTDVSFQKGTVLVPMPSILGHEGAGVVTAVGHGVNGLSEGDHIVVAGVPPCGACVYCLGGQANLCMNGLMESMRPHFKLGGKTVYAAAGTATFAEETVMPAISAVPIPKDVPLDLAALLSCCVVSGVGAVINTARVEPGASVVVVGSGGVGTCVIQGARLAGAAPIVAVDNVERKLEWAKRFGATHAVTPEDLQGLLGDLTGGEGFDYAFEAVGLPETIREAWNATRRGGSTVIVGMGSAEAMVEFSAFELFYSEKKLVGSVYGSADARRDFPRLLRLWRSGRLDLESMISRRIGLGEINEAFAALLRGEVIRTMIEFE